jgi:hypothetical protein
MKEEIILSKEHVEFLTPPLLVLRVSKGAWLTNKRDELK